jgi:ABC-type nickel/cobalt efflux system permease component RcnA
MDHQASSFFFGLSWLVLAALVIALCAAVLCLWRVVRPRPVATARLQHAHELMQALDQYCDWVEAQRHIAFFSDESVHPDSPIGRARAIKHAHFPELSQRMVELLMVHSALVDFFWRQQVQRMKEPEAWAVATDHDETYLELRQQMLDAVRKMVDCCRELVGDVPMPAALRGGGFNTAGA